MVSTRQEIDLRPQLERLDRLLLRSAGVDPVALSFEFRPLWQMDPAASATMALQKAQATQIYAGLNLWPAATTARLAEAQLIEGGFYPGAEGIFAGAHRPAPNLTTDFDPNQLRDPDGRWTNGGGRAGNIDPAFVAMYHLERERRKERKRKKKREREHQKGLAHEPDSVELEAKRAHPPTEPPGSPNQAISTPAPSSQAASPPAAASLAEPLVLFSPPPAIFKPEGIPENWIERPSDSNGGLKWANPDNPNQNVRSMPGNPDSPYPHQQVRYIVHQDGNYRDVNGDLIPGAKPRKAPEAHIPTDQFKFPLP